MSNPPINVYIPNASIAMVSRDGVFTRDAFRFFTDIVRRLGGQQEDHVSIARRAALESEAMMRAVLAGMATGYVHTPAESAILDFTPTSPTVATITVAEHDRSTASATIEAGSVTGVTRGSVYYVYYDDAGNAGGAVTFAATTDPSDLTGADRRTVGAILVDVPAPSGGPS